METKLDSRNAYILRDIAEYYQTGIIPESLAIELQTIAEWVVTRQNFARYSYREEVKSTAVEKMLMILRRKGYDLSRAKAVTYFQRVAYNAFLDRINEETKRASGFQLMTPVATTYPDYDEDETKEAAGLLSGIIAWVGGSRRRLLVMTHLLMPDLSPYATLDEMGAVHHWNRDKLKGHALDFCLTFPSARRIDDDLIFEQNASGLLPKVQEQVNQLRKTVSQARYLDEGVLTNLRALINMAGSKVSASS